MANTIRIDSFSETNVIERGELATNYVAESTELKLLSTQGFEAGQTIFVGFPGREGCESVILDAVADGTTLTLAEPLKLDHRVSESVTAVLGGSIRIYRAPNVDGSVPADEAFTVLVTRTIDPDQASTYYIDPDGSDAYWYTRTYFNPTTMAETARAEPFRGDPFNNYASLAEIRKEAGFERAFNLADSDVELQRRNAQAEINSSLSGVYTVPFSPVPEIIRTLTIQLAAAFLLIAAYGDTATNKQKRDDARKAINDYKNRDSTITDENGNALSNSDMVTGWPEEPSAESPRFFRMRDRF